MIDSILNMIYEDGLILLGLFVAIFSLVTLPAVVVILVNEARRNKHKALEEQLRAEARAVCERRSKPEAA